MCFTPAFVVFLPFAPILGVWGGSLYVSHSMTTRWLESNFNVCVTMARWRYHALGWSTAAGVSVGLATLGTTDYFVAQRTSATILGNHDLKPKEVWDAVAPRRFQQEKASERMAAGASTLGDLFRQHMPAVRRITMRGAAVLAVMGAVQPIAAAAASSVAGEPIPVPTAAERWRHEMAARGVQVDETPVAPVDINTAFREEIALSKARAKAKAKAKAAGGAGAESGAARERRQ